ncbi:MAG: hypothetical protein IT428_00875 [Planctomycetaceae bacterium]|nr:hypothetical protein [Planctomycetaceae bacterium]
MNERVAELQLLVDQHRARWLRLRWLQTVGMAIAVALGTFLLAVILDHFTRLPMIGRVVVSAGVLAAFAYCGKLLWERWQVGLPSIDEIALAIEQRTPGGIENRLINALQIGRTAPAGAGAALVQENWQHLHNRQLPAALAASPAIMAAAGAGVLVLATVIGFLSHGSEFRTAASRILLPFASIDPLYRTTLTVEPGDIEAMGDVEVRVKIKGELPDEIAVLLSSADRTSSIVVPVPAGQTDVNVVIPNVVRSLTYQVRGGDYTSPAFHIEVPAAPRIARVRATLTYPEYLAQAPRSLETTGDLEAVQGTKADIRFELDHPVDGATLVLRGPGAKGGQSTETRVPLKPLGKSELQGEITFDKVAEYRLETQIGSRNPPPTSWQHLRVIADEPPRVELTGIPTTGELSIDSPVTLRIAAADDFGITRFGLFARRAPSRSIDAAADKPAADAGWTALGDWKCDSTKRMSESVEFLAANAGAVEGDRWEFVARAGDAFPGRSGSMTSGPVVSVVVVGDGTQLQLLYEQILRSEAELSALTTSAQKMHQATDSLIRKLDSGELVDDNTPDRIKELVDWAAARNKEQTALRETAARSAREMATAAGSLRLSVGMLADTEMVRTSRVFDSVATRDNPAGRRMALADARATQQRTLQSLQQILDQYLRFRQDWELAHMGPFSRMLADRQAALKEQSQRRADENLTVMPLQREASVRRQTKMAELCAVASNAFLGLAERTQEVDSELSSVFAATAEGMASDELKTPMMAAVQALTGSQWAAAAKEQTVAAERLEQIVTKLLEAQAAATKRLLAAMEQSKESDLASQGDIEKLKQGITEDLIDEPDGLKLKDLIHKAEVEQNKNGAGKEEKGMVDNYLFPDSAVPSLNAPDTGKRQQFEILKLATAPGKTPSFPQQSDRQGNKVKPHIQEEFEDLVGDLLEEEDEMKANYETYNLNAAFNINEPGEIGKQGGDLNSTAAAAATGNMKPPTTNVGGASRVGRQGARAFGQAVGNESINRRGRDKVQEGQERAPDQAGSVKETKSDDPQEDTSTGTGGRKVESDDAKFSQNDAGEFTEDMLGKMDKAKETFHIVERQGKGIDASMAEAMRDLTSKQEQTLERLKSIRKELKNLYLPTEQLDDLISRMQANLHSLSERPTGDVYQLQQKTLHEIRGALQVFHQAHAGFQASLPREQAVRGRVIDDPSRAVPPGYEEAVREYYRRLVTP